ncbi:MAG: response regulator [Mariprofundus sp.]
MAVSTIQGADRDVELQAVETQSRQQSRLILFVDDSQSIRLLVANMLEQLGFTVLLAENGLVGLELFRAHCTKLSAVVMDMTMPVLGGVEAMREMRRIHPDVPIVLMSGYSVAEVKTLCVNADPDGMLYKPFRMADLNQTLSAVTGTG